MVEEYAPIYFPSLEDEYKLPTKLLHAVYPVKLVSADPVIYTFDPVVAEQDVNVRDEKERLPDAIYVPPTIYTPPPQLVAEQEVNVKEESVSFFEVEDNVAEIAPPFADVHRVNDAPLMDCAVLIELNANTAPFPDSSLMSVKVFVPVSVNFPAFTDIKGLLYVE